MCLTKKFTYKLLNCSWFQIVVILQLCFFYDIFYFFFLFSTCYCSKNYISRLMKQFDHECTIKCAGDNTASCGGTPNLVSLYITDSSSM